MSFSIIVYFVVNRGCFPHTLLQCNHWAIEQMTSAVKIIYILLHSSKYAAKILNIEYRGLCCVCKRRQNIVTLKMGESMNEYVK